MLSDRKDIHWVIVGDGRQLDYVREQVAERQLEDCFHLVGRFPLESMPYFMDAPMRSCYLFATSPFLR